MTGMPTKILALITLLTGASGLFAWAHEQKAHARAMETQREAAQVETELKLIANAHSSDAQLLASGLDAVELTRHMISAAVAAGVIDRLVDKDSIPPARVENTDYEQLQLTLSFQHISLRELTGFFQQLATVDPRSRVKLIELSPPEAAGRTAGNGSQPSSDEVEKWTANIAVAYLKYAPRQPNPR